MLLDVNVLLALSWDQHVHHRLAHEKFAELARWSTCSVTEAGLIRLLLTAQVMGRKVTGAQAIAQLEAIRRVPGWSFLPDSESLAAPTIDTRVLMGRKQVAELQLTNLAAANNMQLATFDVAFATSLTPDDRRWVSVWNG